ncbi:MetQ/NlpA family ABC transporter substrate-binding protein, partial [Planococcus sp. SIMBA_143]
IDAGLSPMEDAIALESSESPYANIIAVQAGVENNEDVQALVEVLTSQEIQECIVGEWNGSIVPVEQ